MAKKDADLRNVIAADKSRGRPHPGQPLSRREREFMERKLLVLIERGVDEREFSAALREFGWSDESPKFQNALRLYRAWRQSGQLPPQKP